jgi:Uma2 family endonuclease
MGQALPQLPMSSEEFLIWELAQTGRHEFVGGEVFAMAGAEVRHVLVSGNVFLALRQHLRGTACLPFMSDMKLQSQSGHDFFYPDLMVSCTEPARPGTQFLREPRLLVEVLSPSTAAYDRGEKFARYRRFDSLQEVALIDVDLRRTDVFRRGADGLWVLHAFERGDTVRLASVDLAIEAADLFADVVDDAGDDDHADPPPA